MSEKSRFPIGVNIFLIRNTTLLLGKRLGAAGEGSWGIPGGHLERHERVVDAAVREVREETGMQITNVRFACVVNDPKNPEHYIQFGFRADSADGEPVLCEPARCAEWHWFPFDALPENIFFGHTKLLEVFLAQQPFGET